MSPMSLLARPTVARFAPAAAAPKPSARRCLLTPARASPPETQGPSQTETPTPTTPPAGIPTPTITPSVSKPTPVVPSAFATDSSKGATPDLATALSFAGPAPEAINGRLAMLGFVAALGAELATHTPVLQQLPINPWGIAATFAVFSAASLVPILNGANLREAFGPFRPEAEVLNGRLAMLGLVALVATEVLKGSSLL